MCLNQLITAIVLVVVAGAVGFYYGRKSADPAKKTSIDLLK